MLIIVCICALWRATRLVEKFEAVSTPRTLMLTTKDKSKIPTHVMERFKRFASGYAIVLFDDTDCISFLELEYGRAYADKFKQIQLGAHKADLFRYAYLYKYGGVYLDIKTKLSSHLDTIFPNPNMCYLVATTKDQLYNGIIATPPNNTYIHLLLKDMMLFTNTKHYLLPNRTAMSLLNRFLKHPFIFGYNPTNDTIPNVYSYKESYFDKKHCNNKLDRHGVCNFMTDMTGTKMLQIRDEEYTMNFT